MGADSYIPYIIVLFLFIILPLLIAAVVIVAVYGKALLDWLDNKVNSLWLKKTGLRRRK